jgi:hypothetical protein
VPSGLPLGKHQATVGHNLEGAAGRLQQTHLDSGVRLSQFGRQTGGPGFIVSNDAVFDRHVHGSHRSRFQGNPVEQGNHTSPGALP